MDHPTNRTNANPGFPVRESGAVGMTHHPDMSLVADILVNALRRKYEQTLMEETFALNHVAEPGEVEARVWARIEAELREKKAESDRRWARMVAKQNEKNAKKATRK